MRVYLAGPDVFLPDPAARAASLKAICAQHGLVGVWPIDSLPDEPPAWRQLGEARRIALCNEAHIRGCDALIANLTPFRGPSADAGTVFELGFMRALGRPVFAWSNTALPFTARTLAFLGRAARADGAAWRDGEGLLVEDFGGADNLMLDGAITASGGVLVCQNVPEAARWSDLSAFARCVAAAARSA
ncbi:MAG: nucleoside 2-deoxyribosyltransferase [Rhodospirillales bacterium]|nr:nucleoside 2-deoxyribosyltransferase [Rhodospirillales bacterium]